MYRGIFIFFSIFVIARGNLLQDGLVKINLNGSDSGISELCRTQLSDIFKRTSSLLKKSNDNLWILKMLDASAKMFPSGIFHGNFYDLGNYKKCREVESEDYHIYGKYCLASLTHDFDSMKVLKSKNVEKVKSEEVMKIFENIHDKHLGDSLIRLPNVQLGICVPNGCSTSDLKNLLPFLNFNEQTCSTKPEDPKLSQDSGAIAALVILSIFVALALISTIIDLWLYYTNKKSPHLLLTAFSLYSNGKNLFKSSNNPNQLLCLSGLRTISMAWVIIFHSYSLWQKVPITNFLYLAEWTQNTKNMWMMNGTLAVDSFFVFGGLVLVYTFLNSCDKGVKFNLPLFYIHRYLRLTPALGILILISAFLPKYMGEGPIYHLYTYSFQKPCESNWWRTLLYIQNYKNDIQCLPHSWYLAVDFQLFLLSPIVLISLWKKPAIGCSLLGVLIFLGILSPILIYYFDESVLDMNNSKYMIHYYGAIYARFGSYVIGMALGYIIYKYKANKIIIPKINPVWVIVYWVITITGLLACVYSYKEVMTTMDKVTIGIYSAFDRNCWALSLSMVILACVTGYGGPINAALSLPIFQIMAKLSYSMYLLHPYFVNYVPLTMENAVMFSEVHAFNSFLSSFMVTVIISIPFSLIFESPMTIIEKFIFGRGSRNIERNKNILAN